LIPITEAEALSWQKPCGVGCSIWRTTNFNFSITHVAGTRTKKRILTSPFGPAGIPIGSTWVASESSRILICFHRCGKEVVHD
jgi:hypothetical protein